MMHNWYYFWNPGALPMQGTNRIDDNALFSQITFILTAHQQHAPYRVTQRVSDNNGLSCVYSTILQPTVICAMLDWTRRDMPNIFFHLPLPAQFAWNPAEENTVSNKANPLEKKNRNTCFGS